MSTTTNTTTDTCSACLRLRRRGIARYCGTFGDRCGQPRPTIPLRHVGPNGCGKRAEDCTCHRVTTSRPTIQLGARCTACWADVAPGDVDRLTQTWQNTFGTAYSVLLRCPTCKADGIAWDMRDAAPVWILARRVEQTEDAVNRHFGPDIDAAWHQEHERLVAVWRNACRMLATRDPEHWALPVNGR